MKLQELIDQESEEEYILENYNPSPPIDSFITMMNTLGKDHLPDNEQFAYFQSVLDIVAFYFAHRKAQKLKKKAQKIFIKKQARSYANSLERFNNPNIATCFDTIRMQDRTIPRIEKRPKHTNQYKVNLTKFLGKK
jgi:hypothetical protein